jgi:hypothetical protein
MAGTAAILGALWRVLVRDLRSLHSIAGNNFFIFGFFLLRGSGPFLFVLFGIVVMLPLGSDPLVKVPKERLEMWPLSGRQRLALRAGSLLMSPATWLTLGILVWTARWRLALEVLAVAVAVQVAGHARGALRRRVPRAGVFHWIPRLPGVMGGLVRKDLRQLLSVLDPYPALVLSLCGAAYFLFARNPEQEAKFGLTLLAVLALSTSAQCLFALDGPAGLSRYRLWPLRGWRALAAKGIAFALVAVLVCLPLEPLAALGAALIALAIGNHESVRRPVPQPRWRFTGGSLAVGLVQLIAMMSAANLVHRSSVWVLAACALLWAVSVAYYGHALEAGA